MGNAPVIQPWGLVDKLVQRHEKTLEQRALADFDPRRNANLADSVGEVRRLIASLEKERRWLAFRKSTKNAHTVVPLHLSDFHNHWDGVLPVDRLIALYRENARPLQGWETDIIRLLPLPPPAAHAALNSEEWMFLRLSASILAKKGEPRGKEAPQRGAHLMQYVAIYVWWAVYLEGYINGFSDGMRAPQEQISPRHYQDLYDSTLLAISSLYRVFASRQGGPEAPLRRALAMNALHKYLRATKTAPFDDAYVARTSLLQLIPRSLFDADTVAYLANDESIRYLQVSNPPDKIDEPQQQIDSFNAARPPTGRITVHWLALIASHRAFMASPASPKKDRDQVKKDTDAAMKAVKGDVGGGSVRGVDWAGPECQEYCLGPAVQLVGDTLKDLHAMATPARPLIFRPHVGEGSSLLEGGKSLIETEPGTLIDLIRTCFHSLWDATLENPTPDAVERLCGHRLAREVLRHRDDSFKVLAGAEYDEAVRRATNNVSTLIEAVSQYYGGAPPPNRLVKVRFGHATHATEEQAGLMRDLRIAADINLSSNLRTGALAYMQDLDEGDFYKEACANWNWNSSALDGFVSGRPHSIGRLCRAGVTVVLGSDGQGVEVSTMPYEYLLAHHLIGDDAFRQFLGTHALDQRLC